MFLELLPPCFGMCYTFNKAVLNYDNAIKDAQMQNNSKLAEISFNALQTQLELSLQGFQYKNSLLLEQLNKKQELENTYYSRYQDVLQQMNQENAMAEQIRQYNESLAEQKRQYNQSYQLQVKEYNEGIRQFNENLKMQEKQYKEDIRQFDTQIAYYKEKDAKEYALKIKQLEQEKKQYEQDYKLKQQQLAQAQSQFEQEYKLKQQQMAQSQSQWEKEYALAVSKANNTNNTPKISNNSNPTISNAKSTAEGKAAVEKTINTLFKAGKGNALTKVANQQAIASILNKAKQQGIIDANAVYEIGKKYGLK